MPDVQIQNPSGFYGLPAQINPTAKWFTNGSATARKPGDVVVMSRTDFTGTVVTIATALNDVLVVGIVAPTIPTDSMNTQPSTMSYAVGQDLPVLVEGCSRVNIGAATVAAGDLLTTAATLGTAVTNAGAPAANAVLGSIIAVAIEASGAKDANNTIRCYVTKL